MNGWKLLMNSVTRQTDSWNSGNGSLPAEGDLPVLHRAEWVVPVAHPPIEDGGVLTQGNIILAAGPYRQVKAASPVSAKRVDHGSSAVLPGLVNAHTHLELSGIGRQVSLPKESFSEWLKELLGLRVSMTAHSLLEGFEVGRKLLRAGGCCLCADITNGVCLTTDADGHSRATATDRDDQSASRKIAGPPSTLPFQQSVPPADSPLVRQVFLEVLGFDQAGLVETLGPDLLRILGIPRTADLPISLGAHACYSTSGAVIREAKEWCRARGLRFSIHVAEHSDETEFLERGTGFCREVLENLGRWVPNWTPPGTTPMGYLEQLQALDSCTLLVHAVHMTDADWEIAVRNRCSVCFCPRSNRNLNVGQPDMAKALRFGLTAALGTDSLASNTDLNLFSEAAYVLENFADVHPLTVLTMMTLGGAGALGLEQHFGSIEPGRNADLLIVSLPHSFPSHQLVETIIQQGSRGAWHWAHHSANVCG
jgi:cytosine/adenosine deaminase-related metal-dependent hydrolase